MAKGYSVDKNIKTLVIEDISKIYVYFNRQFTLNEIIRSVTYNSRTKKGFKSMIEMAKKLSKKTSVLTVKKYMEEIEFLMSFYKGV